MKKIILILGVAILIFPHCTQQIFQSTYSSTGLPHMGAALTIADNKDILITGQAEHVYGGPIFLTRVSKNGSFLWTKNYKNPNPSAFTGRGTGVLETNNNEIIIVGSTGPLIGSGEPPVFVIRTDANGNIIWSNSYALPAGFSGPIISDIIESQTGGFIVSGTIFTNSDEVPILFKFNDTGNLMWGKYFPNLSNGHAYKIRESATNEIFIVGESWSSPSSFILKTDNLGNNAEFCEYNSGAAQGLALDNGIVISGHFGGGGIFLSKIDYSGNFQWGKKFDINTAHQGTLEKTPDGFLIQGTVGDRILLLKTDQNGDLQWAKGYSNNKDIFSANLATGHSTYTPHVQEDEGVVLLGLDNNQNLFLVRTDENGNTPCNQIDLLPTVSNLNVSTQFYQISAPSLSLTPSSFPFQTTNVTHNPDIDCSQVNCVPPPSEITAWYPFEYNGQDIVGLNDASLINNPSFQAGQVGLYSLELDGVDDYLTIPSGSANNFGTNAFTIDFWIKTSDTGSKYLIHKMDNPGPGYAIKLNGGALELDLNDGTNITYSSGVSIANNTWHHIALTVDRSQPFQGKWYVDGNLVNIFNPAGQNGSISNGSPLLIGYDGFGSNYFNGIIDEIELFERALSSLEVANIHAAGGNGKCKAQIFAPDCKPMCAGASSATLVFSICNYSGQNRTYTLQSITAKPAGSDGGFCNEDGPNSFTASPNNVSVGPGSCGTITAVVPRPSGLDTPFDVGCYQATFTDDLGVVYWVDGCLIDRSDICLSNLNEDGLIQVISDEPKKVSISLKNTGQPPLTFTYRWRIDPETLGTTNKNTVKLTSPSLEKSVKLAPEQEIKLSVELLATNPSFFNRHELLLESKMERDSVYQLLGSWNISVQRK